MNDLKTETEIEGGIILYYPYPTIYIQYMDCYLRMRDDAVHFDNLLIRVTLGDVKLPHHGRPVAFTTAATEVTTRRETGSERSKKV